MDFNFADSVSVCEFFQLFPDEQSAVHFLEEVRWPDGVLFVHCGSDRTKELTAYKLHQCNACHCRRGRRLWGTVPFSPGGTCGLGRVRRLEGESSLIAHFSVVAAVWGGAPVKLLSGRRDRLASVYVGATGVASSRGPKQPVSLMTAYSPGRGKSMELGIC